MSFLFPSVRLTPRIELSPNHPSLFSNLGRPNHKVSNNNPNNRSPNNKYNHQGQFPDFAYIILFLGLYVGLYWDWVIVVVVFLIGTELIGCV